MMIKAGKPGGREAGRLESREARKMEGFKLHGF
jgi:hypothetical protein